MQLRTGVNGRIHRARSPAFQPEYYEPEYVTDTYSRRRYSSDAVVLVDTASSPEDTTLTTQSKYRPEIPHAPPSEDYLQGTLMASKRLRYPIPLLVLLDLNGTLVYRNKKNKKNSSQRSVSPSDMTTTSLTDKTIRDYDQNSLAVTYASKHPHERPYLKEFLDFLFENFLVMIWSSAQPHNVQGMVEAIFTPEQCENLVAIWSRNTLGLTRSEYLRKSVTLKNFETIWNSEILLRTIRSHLKKSPIFSSFANDFVLNQTNTVLVDDSIVKARKQPFNHLATKEFTRSVWQSGNDEELKRTMRVLEELRYQSNVSNYLRTHPFNLDTALDENGLPLLPMSDDQLH